ncbi:MAG: pyridoxamine 5'-phosphate oxidase family protein [Desulfuromonadaceae bacterium]|jgi:nitroimidazol reductase NimA-like FMN-containing flavoprotein (pyridoxamine 5'-phosphate oxidase superfamily)|nr:pyridoxamine 5'-phosphate oxidase family protein [Desulfuromonadaceae bacterium]
MDRTDSERRLKNLLCRQLFGVLATDGGDGPYASLVAFTASDDLASLFFLTSRTSRKFHNITANPAVALLIDNRSNQPDDVAEATAVTAVGRAVERQGEARDADLKLFLRKHPQLASFASSAVCALLEVVVSRFVLVSRFEEVVEFDMTARR